MLVLPCRRGGVPSLTPEMLRRVLNEEERILSISALDALEHVAPAQGTCKSLVALCNLDEFRLVLSIRSPFVGGHTSAPSNEQGISGDHDTGRIAVTIKRLHDMASVLQPSWVVPIYDAPSLEEPPSKKRRTALERSSRWFQQQLNYHTGNNGMSSPGQLIPSSVLCSLPTVEHHPSDAPTPLLHCVKGIYLDVVNQNESLGTRIAYISKCVEMFRGKALGSAGASPMVVGQGESLGALLGMILAGATHLECAIPWQLADKGKALQVPTHNRGWEVVDAASTMDTVLDLNDPRYRCDTTPLSSCGCRCYTCERHTRAYLHHLLTVQEMNSTILLAVHNLTQLVDMLRMCRQGDTASEQKRMILRYLSLAAK